MHVDGAFGLWALASPAKRELARGVSDADSWAADAHKWLNVPYDSGLAICRNPVSPRAAMTIVAPYLLPTAEPEPNHFVPEMSRRARGIDVWATLRAYGRSGYRAIVERHLDLAQRLAAAARDGAMWLNPVAGTPASALESTALLDSLGPSLMPRTSVLQGVAAGLSVLAARAARRGAEPPRSPSATAG